MLSWPTHAQSHDQHTRSCARRGEAPPRHARLSAITSRPEEGRDVVRPSETHLEAGSSEIARLLRCPRRIYPGCRCPKPSQTGKARNPPATNGAPSCMTKVVMTGSSAARSAKGRKPNGIINTKPRLRILPQRVFQRNWRDSVVRSLSGERLFRRNSDIP